MHLVSKKCVDPKCFMMHANACCTCNLKSTCDMLGYYNCVSSQEPIIQMTSLMHHFSTHRTGMCNQNQCSTSCLKCQFHPPAFCQSIWVYYNHTIMLGNNGHTRCAYTPMHMG